MNRIKNRRISTFNSFAQLKESFHEPEGIETIIKRMSLPLLSLNGTQYIPGESLDKYGLLDKWMSVYRHSRRIDELLTYQDIPCLERVRLGCGLIHHGKKISEETSNTVRTHPDRNLKLDHYHISLYFLDIIKKMIVTLDCIGNDYIESSHQELAMTETKIESHGNDPILKIYKKAKKIQWLSQILDNLDRVEEYKKTEKQAKSKKEYIEEDGCILDNAISFIGIVTHRTMVELLKTAIELGNPETNLATIVKKHVLEESIGRLDGLEKIPPIASDAINTLIPYSSEKEKVVLAKKGRKYILQTIHTAEDYCDLASFNIRIITDRFNRQHVFDIELWNEFLEATEESIYCLNNYKINKKSQLQQSDEVFFKPRTEHYIRCRAAGYEPSSSNQQKNLALNILDNVRKAYNLFSTLKPEIAHYLSIFGESGKHQIDKLFEQDNILKKYMTLPLDRLPQGIY